MVSKGFKGVQRGSKGFKGVQGFTEISSHLDNSWTACVTGGLASTYSCRSKHRWDRNRSHVVFYPELTWLVERAR